MTLIPLLPSSVHGRKENTAPLTATFQPKHLQCVSERSFAPSPRYDGNVVVAGRVRPHVLQEGGLVLQAAQGSRFRPVRVPGSATDQSWTLRITRLFCSLLAWLLLLCCLIWWFNRWRTFLKSSRAGCRLSVSTSSGEHSARSGFHRSKFKSCNPDPDHLEQHVRGEAPAVFQQSAHLTLTDPIALSCVFLFFFMYIFLYYRYWIGLCERARCFHL